MTPLYSLAIFVGAFLLFSMEPMVGKMLLPACGGTPAVWNTCIVFFQAVLLLGYIYTHLATTFLSTRRQVALHLALLFLPLVVLPIGFGSESLMPAGENPTLRVLTSLALAVGLPFFVVSTSAPLLQRWFSRAGHGESRDPYFLYAVSNAGSLLALLSYPLVIEPLFGLHVQSQLWAASYLALVVLVFACAMAIGRSPERASATERANASSKNAAHGEHTSSAYVSLRQRLLWILLALAPSSLMLGVTSHVTTEIASMPLLWVVPLAIYLLTFILVFAQREYVSHRLMIKCMPYAVLLMPLLAFAVLPKLWMVVAVHSLALFLVAMVCHGELAKSRPRPEHLTEFYLWISVGGVLGGMFNTLVAPLVFPTVIEYPLMLVVACFLRPADDGSASRLDFGPRDFGWLLALTAMIAVTAWAAGRVHGANAVLANVLACGIPAAVCFGFRNRPIRFALGVALVFVAVSLYGTATSGELLHVERDFFGVNRVRLDATGRFHLLANGNTVHGIQGKDPSASARPTGYYCRSGPLGDIFNAASREQKKKVAVIGLGVGVMAAYAEAGQEFTFYEIDRAVVDIAADPRLFTFLQDCRGKSEVVLGDARVELARAPDRQYGMIVLDAFSSDSIPTHLVTLEALQLYLQKLAGGGILVFHVSNRYLRLEPMLAALAKECGLVCRSRSDLDVTSEQSQEGKLASRYVVMARNGSELGRLLENPEWSAPSAAPSLWTDDYTSLIGLFHHW